MAAVIKVATKEATRKKVAAAVVAMIKILNANRGLTEANAIKTLSG
jgi:hypothetical protein